MQQFADSYRYVRDVVEMLCLLSICVNTHVHTDSSVATGFVPMAGQGNRGAVVEKYGPERASAFRSMSCV